MKYTLQAVAAGTISKDRAIESPSALGATCTSEGVAFHLWAPRPVAVELHIVGPEQRLIAMERGDHGYYSLHVPGLAPGARYFYRLDGERDRPDPASRCQPAGVHGPSEVLPAEVAPRNWASPPLRDYIVYELHVATFTPEGTLDGVVRCLDRLQNLGVTAVELMPIAEFPGVRNWGYDGVYPFAVHSSYGGAPALRRLAHACHQRGMALVLDVVYNHLGPEGNYVNEFAPYFTDRYRSPWGDALNFDGPGSDQVRRFFLENALYWVRDCGVDALRLDAVHAIYDGSAYPFLLELSDTVQSYARESGRRIYTIAESDLNDARLIRPKLQCGYGLDAQWSDDFHHSLHALLTGEKAGYYDDFGSLEQFAEALRFGWIYSGQYSTVRARRFGNSPAGLAPERFVVCSQNHDQVGNRMRGERLCHLVNWERAKLAAAAVLLSRFTPLLFMGEEYAECAPFLYHVSHSDPTLQEAVREGRKAEFRDFIADREPDDPQSEQTFLRSKLRHDVPHQGRHAIMHAFYSELIRLRKTHDAFRPTCAGTARVNCRPGEGVVDMVLHGAAADIRVLFNFSEQQRDYSRPGVGELLLDSSDPRWAEDSVGTPQSNGAGPRLAPLSCRVLRASSSPTAQA